MLWSTRRTLAFSTERLLVPNCGRPCVVVVVVVWVGVVGVFFQLLRVIAIVHGLFCVGGVFYGVL